MFTLKGTITTAAMVLALLAAWSDEATQEKTAPVIQAAAEGKEAEGQAAAMNSFDPGGVVHAARQY